MKTVTLTFDLTSGPKLLPILKILWERADVKNYCSVPTFNARLKYSEYQKRIRDIDGKIIRMYQR